MPTFRRKRIGLALGSGASRGLAHIGVLEVLEAEGLVPDAIAGTSMGAVVGAFFAAGYPAAEIERIALEVDVKEFMGVSEVALSKGAVFSGDRVQAFLREHLPASFEDLAIPFGCVATDLTRNRPVRFTSGDLIAALRASISIPLAFVPVTMDDLLLVDGNVSEPMPVSLARHLGGEMIVAVDVRGDGTVAIPSGGQPGPAARIRDLRDNVKTGAFPRGNSSLDILGAVSEAFEGRIIGYALRDADVAISPAVAHITGMDYSLAEEAIEAGRSAAMEMAHTIHRKARR